MPPKRKPVSAPKAGPSKRSKAEKPEEPSAPATPPNAQFLDEDDSSSDDEPPQEMQIKIQKAVDRFSMDAHRPEFNIGLNDSVSHLFGKNDFGGLSLKADHAARPLWINPRNAKIIFEAFSPLAPQAQDFLTTVAEPLSRCQNMHEYKLTPHSLYAAVSVGLEPDDIINVLDRLCKFPLPHNIRQFINSCSKSYGKVKLVLKNNRFFVESADPQMLQKLLQDPIIGPLRIDSDEDITKQRAPTMGTLVIPGTSNAAGVAQAGISQRNVPNQGQGGQNQQNADIFTSANAIQEAGEDDEEEEDEDAVHSFEIPSESVEIVQKQCLELECPILEEYDFRNDSRNVNLDIDLKPQARVRPYQEKSLSKMFGNGRAKSGIIVLPCGAGKTLVGITAACTIKKSVVVLCTSAMSVVQWKKEFIKWSTINPEQIAVFTSESKEKFRGDTGIIVSTYSMVTNSRNRSYDSQKMMDFLQGREWGLIILDEVHVVPASIFRKVVSSIATHSKLGLTATLLREDDKIKDLNFLIGPKLYEANWMELSEQGYIAKVQCSEVWCPMSTEFYQEYLNTSHRKRTLLYIMNPYKFQACQYLIDFHEKRGDKIIVFSDNVYALKAYALKLGKCYIYGDTPQAERMTILENFQRNDQVNTLFLSKIGDTSLDLPEATCLIQISSHYGSRRQEAQRLGRILRAKRRNDEGFNAFFYSLVSKDTQEMYYSSKRQAFLEDQGYAFKVITQLQGIEEMPGIAYATARERRELLADVMLQNESAATIVNEDFDGGRVAKDRKVRGKAPYKRAAGRLSEFAGGETMAYVEHNKSRNKEVTGKGKKGPQSSFFKKLAREDLKRKQEQAALMNA